MLMTVPTRRFLFIGHGDIPFAPGASQMLQRHTLAFAGASGGLVTVKPDDLVDMLGSHAPEPLEFVFLNGCHTAALGQACFDAGVPSVLCWSTRVENQAARLFSQGFFEAVGKGYSYKRAFEQAKQAVAMFTRPGRSRSGVRYTPTILTSTIYHHRSTQSRPSTTTAPLSLVRDEQPRQGEGGW